jgi:CubicO group peptidase (beta-lactamase class C family)
MNRIVRGIVSAGLLLFASISLAQIQITPIPNQAPALVMPLGGHVLTALDAEAWLDGLVPYAIGKGDLAGAVVVIVKDGQILVAKGYGYADVSAGKAVSPTITLFRPGSISKLFTWTSVMQLVEQGKLDLDQDVNKYLDFSIPPRDGKPVTLRQLMTHTAGFEETDKNLIIADPKVATDNATWLKTWIPERIYAPGEVSAYSNYGAALAGYIVQRVSGQPFDDYVEQHIFKPLGMEHSTFRQPLPAALEPDMAKGYFKASGPARPFELVIPAPAGALSSSGEDMARFMIAHLQNGKSGDAQILRPETAQQMHNFTHYSVPGLLPIALGFYHMDQNGQTIIGHGGDTEQFHSELMLLPQQNVGVFVSIDGTGKDNAADSLRKQLREGFVDRYFPAAIAGPEPTLPTAREHGALLVGHYVPSRRSVSNFMSMLGLFNQRAIRMDKDGVLITPGFKDIADQPRRWHEVAPFVWRDVSGKGSLAAVMDGNKVRWLSTDSAAPVTVFMPAPGWMSVAWNIPLLWCSLIVLLLTAVLWPIAALVRAACHKPFTLVPPASRWYRWSRVAAIVHLLFAAGWFWVLMQMGRSIANLSSAMDGTIRTVQFLGVLALIGIVAALGNAICAWREPGRWWRKINSVAIVLACLATAWFALSLHLLSAHLNY